MAFRPWLWLPAKVAHDLSSIGLDLARLATSPVDAKLDAKLDAQLNSFVWNRKGANIQFRNRVGIAGGVDKDATQIRGWHHFGAGFSEVGTVTPMPQSPNPGPIVGRDISRLALWNKMGFPSRGADFVSERVSEWHQQHPIEASIYPLLINIGKNRNTSAATASQDYVQLIEKFSAARSAQSGPRKKRIFVINISSPNTKGLRDLFSPDALRGFLSPIVESLNKNSALGLLKLSPDMDQETLASAVGVAVALDLDGFVATNTTTAREPGMTFSTEGGVSGAPLAEKSRLTLQTLLRLLGSQRQDRLIISSGGILSADEAQARFALGADLVELYSALVFSGPFFIKKVLGDLGQERRTNPAIQRELSADQSDPRP